MTPRIALDWFASLPLLPSARAYQLAWFYATKASRKLGKLFWGERNTARALGWDRGCLLESAIRRVRRARADLVRAGVILTSSGGTKHRTSTVTLLGWGKRHRKPELPPEPVPQPVPSSSLPCRWEVDHRSVGGARASAAPSLARGSSELRPQDSTSAGVDSSFPQVSSVAGQVVSSPASYGGLNRVELSTPADVESCGRSSDEPRAREGAADAALPDTGSSGGDPRTPLQAGDVVRPRPRRHRARRDLDALKYLFAAAATAAPRNPSLWALDVDVWRVVRTEHDGRPPRLETPSRRVLQAVRGAGLIAVLREAAWSAGWSDLVVGLMPGA